MIGSGWLLSPMHAAAAAGPASLLTWVVGGLALVLIALVMVELGATMPVAGAWCAGRCTPRGGWWPPWSAPVSGSPMPPTRPASPRRCSST
ncbi:hypothetical protein GXW82_18145 [Streptacidiphilus sp. 4-A2]|nr:hypothetical protein [Streptacidiphilus sp. 4-A2]